MAKLFRIWKGWAKLELSAELAYRFNFLMKSIAHIIFDFIGPLVVLLIYSVSKGLPGWTFEEFLLLQGAFIFVTGIDHTFFVRITWSTIEAIRHGTFDISLIRPVGPLRLATATAVNLDGLPSLCVGSSVIIYALIKMGWIFSLPNLLAFLFLLGLGALFVFSIDIIIASLAFLAVKSYGLLNIFEQITNVGKNPLTIYGVIGVLVLTFVFPIGLAGFYPAEAILGRLPTIFIGELALVAVAFFAFSLLMWELAIKKYTSAGG